MSVGSLLPVILMYLVSLMADGCLYIAIALAATTGGRPLLWGACFGIAHAVYAIVGVALAVELAEQSEILGSLVAFVGSLVLLRHFFHHRIHHQPGGDCSCESHHAHQVKISTIALTAFALSFHSIATGAVVRGMFSGASYPLLFSIVLFGALCVGTAVFVLVYLGEGERHVITRIIDKTPGISAAILSGICVIALSHFVEHLGSLSGAARLAFFGAGALLSIFIGYVVHERSAVPRVVQISSRKV